MTRTGQDWWRFDADFGFWRALRTGGTTEPVPVDPDPEPDPDDPFPDPSGRQVLLVTESGTLGAGNQALHDILVGDGWTVTVRSLADPEDYADVSVLVMSAGNPQQDDGRYLFPQVGVVAVDSWRRFGMGAGLGFATDPLDVTVVDTSSPLSAGYSGTFPAYLAAAWLTWKPESDGALSTVVTRAGQPDQRVVFAYEAGSQMPGRYATTRHVGLGYHQDGFAAGLSTQAEAQFLAAVRWARDTTVAPLPVPAAPAGLSAAPSDSQVRLSWSAADYAETYIVRRAAVTGGPYTVLASQITATSYTDSTAVNDTAYFYVVAARNSSGDGPDSAEVTATPTVSSSETLAMLASSDELAMWKDRAANGPFQTAGDYSANSPGHWSEMSAAMGLNFASGRWDGPIHFHATTGRYLMFNETVPGSNPPRNVGTENDANPTQRRMAHDMMSAAYAAMVTDNNAVAQAITNEIEYHATRPNLNYGSRTLYPFNTYGDIGLFIHAVWMKDLVLAYDITRAMGYPSATVEQWFLNMAEACEDVVHGSLGSVFPNRKSDSYVSRASHVNTTVRESVRLANGTTIKYPRITNFFNNRRSNQAGLYGLVGVLTDNTYYKNEFKRYCREWLMFGHRATELDGLHGDVNRGRASFPQLGFSYSLHAIESLIPAMDALARQGDTSLYEFSSSDGAATPEGGTNQQKSMEDVIGSYIRWITNFYPAQYTTSNTFDDPPPSSIAGDPYYRIQSRNMGNGREIVNDAMLLLPANYFNRSDWQDAILRQGTPFGFTNPVNTVGAIAGWRCDWRHRFLRSIDTNPYGGS